MELELFYSQRDFYSRALDRVQFYNLSGTLIGDTNILDLDQSVFSRTDMIIEGTIDGVLSKNESSSSISRVKDENSIKKILTKKEDGMPLTISTIDKNNFFVKTLSEINFGDKNIGYILVSEQANDILNAVKERKDFILRTVFAVALVILIFSPIS